MKGSVLIVENESLVREAMEDILGAYGLKAIGAGDGPEGIATYQAHQQEIELVILDMRLPGMNGPEILKVLRKINPGIKVIISSAYDEKEIRRGFNGEPITSILKKPFSADSLLSSVQTVMAQS